VSRKEETGLLEKDPTVGRNLSKLEDGCLTRLVAGNALKRTNAVSVGHSLLFTICIGRTERTPAATVAVPDWSQSFA
jgi:hypothetical protein